MADVEEKPTKVAYIGKAEPPLEEEPASDLHEALHQKPPPKPRLRLAEVDE